MALPIAKQQPTIEEKRKLVLDFLEASVMGGNEVTYTPVKTYDVTKLSGEIFTHDKPINTYFTFDERPSVKLLKEYGWYREDAEIKPIIAYLPSHLLYNRTDKLQEIMNQAVSGSWLSTNGMFTPDGKKMIYYATNGDTVISEVIDDKTIREIKRLSIGNLLRNNYHPYPYRFSNTGKYLLRATAINAANGTVYCDWDNYTFEAIPNTYGTLNKWSLNTSFSGNDRFAFPGVYNIGTGLGLGGTQLCEIVNKWDISTVATMGSINSNNRKCIISYDGNSILCTGSDDRVRVYDFNQKTLEITLNYESESMEGLVSTNAKKYAPIVLGNNADIFFYEYEVFKRKGKTFEHIKDAGLNDGKFVRDDSRYKSLIAKDNTILKVNPDSNDSDTPIYVYNIDKKSGLVELKQTISFSRAKVEASENFTFFNGTKNFVIGRFSNGAYIFSQGSDGMYKTDRVLSGGGSFYDYSSNVNSVYPIFSFTNGATFQVYSYSPIEPLATDIANYTLLEDEEYQQLVKKGQSNNYVLRPLPVERGAFIDIPYDFLPNKVNRFYITDAKIDTIQINYVCNLMPYIYDKEPEGEPTGNTPLLNIDTRTENS